jgi:hypothetical protein
MFARLLLPAALLVLPVMGAAQPSAECPLTDDQTSCSRVLACFGEAGRWFEGRAVGRGLGSVAGTTNDGVTCTGVWTSENGEGQGEARASCDDGLSVTVITTYQDYYTGTAIGQGVASTGVPVTSWSGLHVLEFLSRESATGRPALPCGPADIPIS